MKLLVVSKAVAVITANKAVAIAVGMSLLVAVPTTLYISEKQKSPQQVVQKTEQTEQNEATGESVPTTVGDNDATEATPTDTSTQNKTPSISTNDATTPTSPTTPTTTTPAPTPPYVANWNAVVESGWPMSCGWQNKPCSLNQSLDITVNFYDSTTNRQINITSCSGYTKQSWGTNTGHTATTTMSVVNGKTCSVNVAGPFYQGSYYVWADVTTNENTPYSSKGFNFISSVVYQ